MSSKKKTHGTRASQDDGRRKAEDVRAMETARELRARRGSGAGSRAHRQRTAPRTAPRARGVRIARCHRVRIHGVASWRLPRQPRSGIGCQYSHDPAVHHHVRDMVHLTPSGEKAHTGSATGAKLPLAASEHKLNAAGSKQLLMPRSSCHSPVDRRPRSRRPTWPYSACLRTSGSAGRILS